MGTSPFTAQTTGIMKCLLLLATLTLLGVCWGCEDGERRFGRRHAFRCRACSPGTAGVGGIRCPSCLPGTFQSERGQTMCNVCPVGTYQDRRRQRTCKECPDGLLTATTGATSIEECIGYTPATRPPVTRPPVTRPVPGTRPPVTRPMHWSGH